MSEECLPGGEARQWNRRRVHIVLRARFRGQLIRQGNRVFGLGTVSTKRQQSIDGIADGPSGDSRSNRHYHAGKVMARNGQRPWNAGGSLVGYVPLQLVDDDRRRGDAHQDLARARTGLWGVFVDKMVGTATTMEANGFHNRFSAPCMSVPAGRHE